MIIAKVVRDLAAQRPLLVTTDPMLCGACGSPDSPEHTCALALANTEIATISAAAKWLIDANQRNQNPSPLLRSIMESVHASIVGLDGIIGYREAAWGDASAAVDASYDAARADTSKVRR